MDFEPVKGFDAYEDEDAIDKELREFFIEEGLKEDEKPNTAVLALGQDAVALKEAIKSTSEDMDAAKHARDLLDAEIQSIKAVAEKAIRELNDKRVELNAKIQEWRLELVRLNNQLDQIKRRLQIEMDRIRNSVKFKQNMNKYDVVTAGLFWREWAMPHQIEGGQVLANSGRYDNESVGNGCILADDMGLGKTLTLLIAADMAQAKRVLIVTPANVTSNFEREARKWVGQHRPVISMYKMPAGQRKALMKILSIQEAFTILINYESWRADETLTKDLAELGFDTVIADEFHVCKTASTSSYQGIRDIVRAENCCPKCDSLRIAQRELAHLKSSYEWYCLECGWCATSGYEYTLGMRRSVRRVYPATGTPILNRPQELFTGLSLILPEVFEKERDYLEVYCEQDSITGYWGWKKDYYGNPIGLDILKKHLKGRFLQRGEEELAKAGIHLPKQDIIPHDLDITPGAYPDQYRIIQDLRKYSQIILDSGKGMTMMSTLALITRQRQANVWPGSIQVKDEAGDVIWSVGDEVKESIKLDYASGLIDNWTIAGRRVAVFSQFVAPLHRLKEMLTAKGIRAVVFDGSTKEWLRDAIKKDFDRESCEVDGYKPKWDVVLCNYKTGGVGLNFTAATRTVATDEEWNPGKNDQAHKRTKRIGQTEETEVHIIRLNKTIDQWMVKLNQHKAGVVDGFNITAQDLQKQLRDDMLGGEFI